MVPSQNLIAKYESDADRLQGKLEEIDATVRPSTYGVELTDTGVLSQMTYAGFSNENPLPIKAAPANGPSLVSNEWSENGNCHVMLVLSQQVRTGIYDVPHRLLERRELFESDLVLGGFLPDWPDRHANTMTSRKQYQKKGIALARIHSCVTNSLFIEPTESQDVANLGLPAIPVIMECEWQLHVIFPFSSCVMLQDYVWKVAARLASLNISNNNLVSIPDEISLFTALL